MSDKPEDTVIERLVQLLDRGGLPTGGPAEAAERLIERLKRPARVALLGLPGAGKSAILNLLAGTIVVPETLRLPTIIVQHGAQDRMLCTLSDGQTEAIAGSDLAQVLTRNPALVTVERDLPALKVISLLEVSAGPMDVEQRRAATWASKRADIVIWCTTSYLPKEQAVWESMPDMVKDNGFLFVTKTDLLGSADAATGVLERIEQRAGEDFRQVFAISAKLAREAMAPGAPVDRDKFRQSGAASIISAIKARVQAARRADTDTGEVLLARHVEAGQIVASRFASPGVLQLSVAAPNWSPPPELITAAELESRPPAGQDAASVPSPAVPTPDAEPTLATEDEDTLVAKILAQVTIPVPPIILDVPITPPGAAPTPRQPDAPDPKAQASTGSRLSDRLRQTPEPNEIAAAPSMPLRSTWKSPTEAAETRPAASRSPPAVRRDLERSAAMQPAVPPPDAAQRPEPITPAEVPVPSSSVSAAVLETGDGSGKAIESPAAPPERVSVFAARKPAAEAQKPGVAPPVRTAPAEPVTRMRGPAPSARPAQEPLAPEALATPRFASNRRADGGGERRERPRISARVAPPTEDVAPAVAASDVAILEEAIALIIARSGDLMQRIDPTGKLQVDTILEHGRKTIETVSDLLMRGTSSNLRRISTGLGDVLDLIMLMQLEKGHAPADDTLTLILQIRRDLEILRAA